MDRSGGLVQRRNVVQHRENSSPESCRDLDDRPTNDGYRDDEHDSKETRLTLMEEILLLGLKDKEVIYW